MSILISGRGKSGTTGMYNAVKAALPPSTPDWVCVFEPGSPKPMQSLRRLAPDAPILTKVIVNREPQAGVDLDDFAHRVMMVRDPRDVLISTLLFRPLVVRSIRRVSDENNNKYIAALEEKEADPTSWSVKDLFALGDELGLVASTWDASQTEMIELGQRIREDGYFAMAYEDFIDKKFDSLSNYLGFDLGGASEEEGPGWLSHISRSKGYGAWKDWFTPADVEFFGPLYRTFSVEHGYDDDWELAATPAIDPATSSEHVRSRLAGRKEQLAAASGELNIAEFTSEQIEVLEGQASDGILRATRIAAEVRRDGPAELHDPALSFKWAQLAAWMGDARGTELLIDSYRSGIGTDPDPAAVALWSNRLAPPKPKDAKPAKTDAPAEPTGDKKSARARHRRRVEKLEAEIAALHRELGAAQATHTAEIAQLKNSKRYQLGDKLVRGMTKPKNLLNRTRK